MTRQQAMQEIENPLQRNLVSDAKITTDPGTQDSVEEKTAPPLAAYSPASISLLGAALLAACGGGSLS